MAQTLNLANVEKQRLQPESDQAHATFVQTQAETIVARTGIRLEAACKIVEAQCRGTLLASVLLWFDHHDEPVTVAEVLANPARWVGELLADPIEGIEYGRGKAKIMQRDDGSLWIHSFAHGRTTYDLKHGVNYRREPPKDAGSEDHDIISEGSVADAFADAYEKTLRYCHSAGAWYVWDGTRRRKEKTKLAYRWAHQKARELAQATEKNTTAIQAAKAAFAGGVERLAQSERRFAVTSEIWDTDPWLLGTPAGTVNLRTGDILPAIPGEHITKLTAVGPAEMADCPIWQKFLKEACAENEAYICFLQQFCGYCLTGDTSEHALLFAYGPGGNGKTVFLNTISGILGDYTAVAAMDTFTDSKSDRHPTDLAKLHGARLVSVSETEEGHSWAETRIKQITGGDVPAPHHHRACE